MICRKLAKDAGLRMQLNSPRNLLFYGLEYTSNLQILLYITSEVLKVKN